MKRTAVLSAALVLSAWQSLTLASSPAVPDSVALLKSLIRIDSSNPPGDTTAVAAQLKQLFDEHGVDNEIIVAPNGKAAHFIARLKGDGSLRPVLIAAHTDVVPVQRERWSVDPFSGVEKDGYVYGRGALDNKGAVAAYATAVLKLKNERVRLRRDIIFLAEADEEQGEFNTGWLAQHHWPKIDAEFTLNEGGGALLDENGSVRLLTVSTADKLTLNLKLVATGKSGHSSRPLPLNETANGQLIDALAKLSRYQTRIELTETSREYLRVLADLRPGPFAAAANDLLSATDDESRQHHATRMIAADDTSSWGIEGLIRNTLVITMIDAGVKPNVIPGSAEAVLNARLLPGHTVDEFIAEVARVIDNPKLRIEIVHRLPQPQLAEFFRQRAEIQPSPTDTALFTAIRAAARKTWPKSRVVPTLLVASTDATPWRQRGVPVYGIGPFPSDRDTTGRVHGDDEHVAVHALRQGSEFVYDILRGVATKAP